MAKKTNPHYKRDPSSLARYNLLFCFNDRRVSHLNMALFKISLRAFFCFALFYFILFFLSFFLLLCFCFVNSVRNFLFPCFIGNFILFELHSTSCSSKIRSQQPFSTGNYFKFREIHSEWQSERVGWMSVIPSICFVCKLFYQWVKSWTKWYWKIHIIFYCHSKSGAFFLEAKYANNMETIY